jgi:hypothetical protein
MGRLGYPRLTVATGVRLRGMLVLGLTAVTTALADLLTSEFPADRTSRLALYALTYCDLTTGPDGQPVEPNGPTRS